MKEQTQKTIIIILAFLFLISAFTIVRLKLQEDNPMIDASVHNWGYNEKDASELIFRYRITNYGPEEIKDITVKCKAIEDDWTFSYVHDYGNLASYSSEYVEFNPKRGSMSLEKEYIVVCYVQSCKDCEILYKKIPSLVEAYKL